MKRSNVSTRKPPYSRANLMNWHAPRSAKSSKSQLYSKSFMTKCVEYFNYYENKKTKPIYCFYVCSPEICRQRSVAASTAPATAARKPAKSSDNHLLFIKCDAMYVPDRSRCLNAAAVEPAGLVTLSFSWPGCVAPSRTMWPAPSTVCAAKR